MHELGVKVFGIGREDEELLYWRHRALFGIFGVIIKSLIKLVWGAVVDEVVVVGVADVAAVVAFAIPVPGVAKLPEWVLLSVSELRQATRGSMIDEPIFASFILLI